MQNLKIKVNNAEESERAQRAFFALGGKWFGGSQNIVLSSEYYLSLTNGVEVRRGWDELQFERCYNHNIVSLPELEDLATKHKYQSLEFVDMNQVILGRNTCLAADTGNEIDYATATTEELSEHVSEKPIGVVRPELEQIKNFLRGEGLTPIQRFFDYWKQEHNILTLASDFWEMERLFKDGGLNSFETMVEESEAQRRYESALKHLLESKNDNLINKMGEIYGDFCDEIKQALHIAAGLPL